MNRIREARLALNMSQAELADILRKTDPRIDRGMVSRFEQDVCVPTADVLESLSRAVHTPPRDLFPEIELSLISDGKTLVSEITALLGEIIPFGKENAVKRDELRMMLGTSDREMRKAVAKARKEGLIIINDQNGGGYYRSDDIEDMKRQLKQTHKRALNLLAQEKALKRSIEGRENEDGLQRLGEGVERP